MDGSHHSGNPGGEGLLVAVWGSGEPTTGGAEGPVEAVLPEFRVDQRDLASGDDGVVDVRAESGDRDPQVVDNSRPAGHLRKLCQQRSGANFADGPGFPTVPEMLGSLLG